MGVRCARQDRTPIPTLPQRGRAFRRYRILHFPASQRELYCPNWQFASLLSKSGVNFVNRLYYGDNLDVLRRKIASESVDLCYIDPPFNSKRNYF